MVSKDIDFYSLPSTKMNNFHLDLLRSEPMVPVRLWIHRDAAHSTFIKLGEINSYQIRDLNASKSLLQRHFVSEVKLCDEMQRRLAFLRSQLPPTLASSDSEASPSISSISLHTLSVELAELESRLRQFIDHDKALEDQLVHNEEYKTVLATVGSLLDDSSTQTPSPTFDIPSVLESDGSDIPLLRNRASSLKSTGHSMPSSQEPTAGSKLGYIVGIFSGDKLHDFQRNLWRSTRGNFFLKHITLPDLNKTVFLCFYSGSVAKGKMVRVCEALGGRIFPISPSPANRVVEVQEVELRIQDLEQVLSQSKVHKRMILDNVRVRINTWTKFINREKAVFHALNQCNFDASQDLIMSDGWTLTSSLDLLKEALQRGSFESGLTVSSFMEELKISDQKEEPPTYFKTGKIFKIFQSITDSYGVPKYGEINPALFSLITFPFLFSLMFSDIGHGLMMAVAAWFLISQEKKLEGKKLGDIMAYMYTGRYILFIMGLLSIYVGLIFNDAFSQPLHLFSSSYTCSVAGDCFKDPSKVYPIGFDWIWKISKENLLFFNSFKMKFSIVIGVLQMTVGLVLSMFNYRHFNKKIDIYTRFLPEVTMLLSVFGYLVLTIYIKWLSVYENTFHAPSLIHMLINMFLSPGQLTPNEYALFSGQLFIQQFLLVLFGVSILWLLLAKPIIVYRSKRGCYQNLDDASDSQPFPELVVNQVIHTIEFVLGCVSNTASYLRLWALSLSHAALSDVFWDMLLVTGVKTKNPLMISVTFLAWTFATVGVLVIMESLSAFLHSLRLHWVESEGKYRSSTNGVAFSPFTFYY
ncbi:hypothetical protein GEMRC1_003391 [Eukaryota sp. GEM-RC1]